MNPSTPFLSMVITSITNAIIAFTFQMGYCGGTCKR